MQNFQELPKLRDSLSYVYVEHAVLDKHQQAVEFIRQEGRALIPVASLGVLMLGPGTSITHAAIMTLARNGCSVMWTGEDAIRFYAQGMGETRRAWRLLHQAELVCDPQRRLEVVERMYRHRFARDLPEGLSLAQIRGMEGVRVRQAYAEAARRTGVVWRGRQYDLRNWQHGDPINRALSAANALLNGICHTAILSGGYSPALGFIHTGMQTSFVFDIADLYKVELTIPVAFETTAESDEKIESRVRAACRLRFREARLLHRILPDIDALLDFAEDNRTAAEESELDENGVGPIHYWEPLELEDNAGDDT